MDDAGDKARFFRHHRQTADFDLNVGTLGVASCFVALGEGRSELGEARSIQP